MHMMRSSGLVAGEDAETDIGAPEMYEEVPDALHLVPGVFHRAATQWIIDLPEPQATVSLEGLSPTGANERFKLPLLRVLADYSVGDDQGVLELRPQAMVLLPEQQKFYLVFRHVFGMEQSEAGRAALRLRTEHGWFESSERM